MFQYARSERKLAVALSLCCLISLVPRALAQEGISDTADTGGVCVDALGTDINYITDIVKSAGGQIRWDQEWDHYCYYWSDHHEAFLVPRGMERWTEEFLSARGFSVFHTLGTAGGSGYSKRRVPREYIFDSDVTPGSINQIIDKTECRLESRLSKFFEEININRECQSPFPEEELCWNFWVAGHLSRSKGLSPQNLENNIDDGYWFSSRLEVWIGDIANYRTNDGAFIGAKARLDLATISTKFARAPATTRLDGSRYDFISNFDSSIDPNYIDELIANRIIDLLTSVPLECSEEAD